MNPRAARFFASTFVIAGLLLFAAGPASATTFCVPAFTAACPDNGTNVLQPDLQTALTTDGDDGVADKVHVGAYTYVDSHSLDLQNLDSDALDIIGSGPGSTFLTSSSSNNEYVVNLANTDRKVSLSGVTVVVPSSMPDGGGSGMQIYKGSLTDVDVKSLNPDSNGAVSIVTDGTWKGGHIYGQGTGSFRVGVGGNDAPGPGEAVIEDVSVTGVKNGFQSDQDQEPMTIRRCRVVNPTDAGLFQTNGSTVRIENSLFQTDAGFPISVYTNNNKKTSLTILGSTIVADAATIPAIDLDVWAGNGSADGETNVSGTIIRGYPAAYRLQAATGANTGDNKLTIDYSNFDDAAAQVVGDHQLTLGTHNINIDPMFVGPGDYRLREGSPSIDAADPASALTEDLLGDLRPVDGDRNGTAIGDQGAFEFDPPVLPDTAAPVLSKFGFKAPGRKAGKITVTTSEASTVSATLTPKPAGKGKKKRKRVKLSAKASGAGTVTLKIAKGKLKAGKYSVSISARDAAGNRSKVLKRSVRIR